MEMSNIITNSNSKNNNNDNLNNNSGNISSNSSNTSNNNNNNNNNNNKNGSKKSLTDAELLADMQALKAASDTLKKNPKMEFSNNDLLRMLCYMEGEIQARDVAIAALKSEKLKNFINLSYYQKKMKPNDPHAALYRDTLALSGNIASRETSAMAAQADQEMRCINEQQLESLSNVIKQQRQTHLRMLNILKDTEEKYKKVLGELAEERRKNESTSNQDDTSNLESERQRLKREVEELKATKEQVEANLKSLQESIEVEKNNHKQIVLFLLNEHKKNVMKYIEERKRSEDLAQILSEEKQRVDSIAEGLEEESKKSLRMEAELEKQTQAHEHERKIMMINLAMEEKKVKEIEAEINRLKLENDALKKSHPLSPRLIQQNDGSLASNPMVSSVAKVVQPTATVSSVPVTGPTTGVARSLSPGQCLRQSSLTGMSGTDTIKVGVATSGTIPKQSQNPPQPPVKKSTLQSNMPRGVPPPIPPNKPIINKPAASQPSSRTFIQQNSTGGVGVGLASVTSTVPVTPAAAANSSQKDSSAQLMDYGN